MPSQLQSFGIYKIHVGRRDGEDDTVGLRNVFGDEVAGLLLDIGGLIANGYLLLLALSPRAERLSSPTLVNPGKSTSVKLRTCGE